MNPFPGAAEAICATKARGIPWRFVTNLTTGSRATIHQRLTRVGLPIDEHELITAAYAGVLYLRKLENPRCHFVLEEDTLADYAEFQRAEKGADFVVVGDIGTRWDFALMNRIFRLMMDGASLIAMHRGRFFQVTDGLEIDTGAFISGLEYATGKDAKIIGKPETEFFQLALNDMGLAAQQTLMIGDDLISDIGGAQRAGIKAFLVKTGKYREGILENATVTPDGLLSSIAQLPDLLS